MLRARDILFGEIAVALKLLTREALDECIEVQRTQWPRRRLGVICQDRGYLEAHQVQLVLSQQAKLVSRRG